MTARATGRDALRLVCFAVVVAALLLGYYWSLMHYFLDTTANSQLASTLGFAAAPVVGCFVLSILAGLWRADTRFAIRVLTALLCFALPAAALAAVLFFAPPCAGICA